MNPSFPLLSRSSIEALEARIAPAAVFTYTDVDGDLVTVKTSKGTNAELAAALEFIDILPGKQQLVKVDLSSSGSFNGTDLIISAKRSATGDGMVNVGYIDATSLLNGGTSLDLGKVLIKGDLGQIDAGNNNNPAAAIKSLTVNSLGRFGLATQGGMGTLNSGILGDLAQLRVLGDMKDVELVVAGSIGKVNIVGSLIGGAENESGRIFSSGGIGSVAIKGSIIGGAGISSGTIATDDVLGSVKIGGSLIGGSGLSAFGSGGIYGTKTIGTVTIGGDIEGKLTTNTGIIFSKGPIASVSIGGSLEGGSGVGSGRIISEGQIGSVKIGGDIKGGSGPISGGVLSTELSSLTVKGSVLGGSGNESGTVASGGNIGTIKIFGDLKGGSGESSGKIMTSPNGNIALNIMSLTIGGDLAGGTNTNTGAVIATGKIGSVKIGGSLLGGTHANTGVLGGTKGIGSVAIGDDIRGGTATTTGVIFSGEAMESLVVGGDIVGGTATGTDTVSLSGAVFAAGLKKAVIKGSLIAGTDLSTGDLVSAGSIVSSGQIGSLTIKGNIAGNDTHKALISAVGDKNLPANATADIAIAKLKVGGNVENAQVLAGYFPGVTSTPTNENASIGTVTVGGNWTTSSLVAGVQNLGADGQAGGVGADADHVHFGNAQDALIGNGNDALIARIAKIQIGGIVSGSAAMGDHFGFTAQQIDALKIGGKTFARTTATDSPLELSPLTGDVTVREV